jgi:hypothetical protein
MRAPEHRRRTSKEIDMTRRRDDGGPWARWREHRRARRQQALERAYLQQDRLRADTAAYVDADNHARRWTSYFGTGI